MSEINPELFTLVEELVPFAVLLEGDLTICGLGTSLRRRYPSVVVGRPFSEHFEVLGPFVRDTPLKPDHFVERRFLMIRLQPSGLRLRGSARRIGRGLIILEVSPAVSSEEELHRVGLKYDDLPLHDNTLDLVILLRAHGDALLQAKKLTLEVGAQNKEIALTKQELLHGLEQERTAAQFRDRVLGMLSHEFRTSLAQILSVAELLKRGIALDQPERLQKHGVTLSDAVLQITETFEGLSNYAKSEVATETYCELIDVASLIDDAIQRVPNEEVSGVRVRTYESGPVGTFPTLESNRSLLLITLTNLLNNAIKYSRRGDCVTVEHTRGEDEVTITVADNGIGIPSHQQEDIFEAYVRGKNVGRVPGSGLGLAVVALCVDALGGRVQVQSKVDIGTTFSVILPISRG